MRYAVAILVGMAVLVGCTSSPRRVSAAGPIVPPKFEPLAAKDKPYELGPINVFTMMEVEAYLDEAVKRGDKSVTMRINSPGGSVFAAFAIVHKIEELGIPVHCAVDGMAASAAFVILQGCTTRTATGRSMLMIHRASAHGEFGGGEDEFRNTADFLRVINAAMISHCAARMGMTEEAFGDKIEGTREWWFTAREALGSRAIDAVR